jgi:cytochrome c-type biogenesis protein CcmE
MMLLACNGSGGGDLLAGGGIGGTGISIGEISAFGSVIVNDVNFGTEEAEVIVNGNSLGVGDSTIRGALAVGMVVRVEGKYRTDGTAKAGRIFFTSNVKGPVQSITPIDSVVKILSLIGQSVIVDDRTRFENTAFDLLAENNVLEVSGWLDANGAIRATYVGKISDTLEPGTEIMIKGIVTETNIVRRSFGINQLLVDISEITDPVPAVGQLVIVNGILDDNGILVAVELLIEDELGRDDADSVEIEGIVSQVSSPTDFILGTTAVQTDEATSISGLEPDDIVPGARLLVKGALTKRQLLADEVISKDKVNIEGPVAVADVIENQITLKGLDGLVISVSELARIFGDASNLDDIRSGQNVKVLGYAATQNKVEATQVKVSDVDKNKLKLQGPVTDLARSIVTVFKVDVDTNSIPDDGFKTEIEGAVSRDEFLDLVAVGDTVSVNGNLVGDMARWKEIELKKE